MDRITWSNAGKKIARQAFGAALAREEASLLADFKARAAAAATQDDMWAVYRFLAERDGTWAEGMDSVIRNGFSCLRCCARWQRDFERDDRSPRQAGIR